MEFSFGSCKTRLFIQAGAPPGPEKVEVDNRHLKLGPGNLFVSDIKHCRYGISSLNASLYSWRETQRMKRRK